jgi:hypothetical protein
MTTVTQEKIEDQQGSPKYLFQITEDLENITGGSTLAMPETKPGTVDWYSLYNLQIVIPVEFELEALEIAADSGDEQAFIEAARNIQWELRPPEDFLRAIQLAFAAGAHLYARILATRGAEQFPDHQELQKYARILAPPRIIRNNLPPDPTIRANREWLKAHGGEYKGQWIALRNGELLGTASTLGELKEQIGQTDNILFTTGF